jgi:PadR family transcriptional regulator, regulatory protein AphA
MSHRYLILGLLSEHPMTGYDIKKRVQENLSTVTNASYGTLYPMLHRLLKEGAVKVKEIPQRGRPSKKVYRISQAGLDELQAWLKQPASDDQIKREFLLKLYLAKALDPQQLRALVDDRRDEIEARLRSLRAEKKEADSPQQIWVLDYALYLCRAEIDWLKQLEATLGVA